MNVARFSVRRPIFTVMAALIVILLGSVSLSRLPVDLMPDVTYPTLSISTSYGNASPEEMETLVTRPIEEAMSAVPGVEEVTSISSEGTSSVRVTFVWGTDLDAAANDIRDRLDRVIPRLPEDADRPFLRKFDLASFPILIMGASSNMDPLQMRRIIDNEIKYRIERIPGVAMLDIWGGREREIHVNLDPDRLKSLDVPLEQVLARLRAANVTLPAGEIESGGFEITLRTPGEFTGLDQIRDTVLAVRQNAVVRVRDVADVADRWIKVSQIVRLDGQSGVRLSVNKQSGTNTVEVATRVLAEVERINADIPQILLTPVIDTSDYIRRSITNVGSSALYGGMIAVFVLLFFLRNISSTAVIAAAIPVSVVGTFALIYFGGFTLNIMTLGGLALGVGMLVDNAIVVLENIFRLRASDSDPAGAAVKGAEEVAAAIIASTLTTLAIFLPLIFLEGMAGIMFKQLAYVISFALISSLVVALTLIPMLASRFLGPPAAASSGLRSVFHQFYIRTGAVLEGLEEDYKRLLDYALSHRMMVILFSFLLLGASLFLIPWVGVELMPKSDESEVRVSVEMEVGTALGVVDELFREIETIVYKEVPERKSVVSSIGGTPWRGGASHAGEMRIALVPQSERSRSSEQIAMDLRRVLSDIPGAVIRTREGQGLFLLRQFRGGTERVSVEIRGYDLETADVLAVQVRDLLELIPGVTDALLSRDTGAPERLIVVDRAKAEAMKVTVRQVADMLQTVLSGTVAGYFRDGGDEYGIRVKLADAERRSMRDILDLTVPNADNQPVVLRNIISEQKRSGAVRVERKDQERIIAVNANIAGRDMGAIIADAREALRTIPVPAGFMIGFGGDYEEQQKAFGELGTGFILALILVYMVMACLYESLRDPFVVMFSVPMAAIGVILMLFLSGTTFNMQSYIGCIMLGGIVVNNAILLVDTSNRLRREEKMVLEAAVAEAGRRRLRPILMTAMTTICALLPLAIGIGEGGEAQAPMARAVIGGLASSTLITLVFLPVVYSIAHRGDGPPVIENLQNETGQEL
ncbi:MAG: efflux RND transporter permease subunit [Desulfobacteraceae bacterium]|jgi:HAE1 family hydrophobic/amphiphilic exporter-1|nr:MAG: efflux RND transporter permease subunit [Desulfobacteraceae bacterium]